ncbi:hypothetical protein PCANC_02803 [Puccinia coronata f. sp. avenae]|uniref:Uncharacterized protein n=2 Tax=Puccinia coronata f. sp. avenae TaxID=200324 RepID=A0A2N5W473_9BASI|nr:hypothetical protein PCANC_02803 [Puccinia coronata f. sp. avenae]
MSSGTCLRVPGTRLRVPVGFQQVPANGCRVQVRVSGFGVKKQADTRQIPTLQKRLPAEAQQAGEEYSGLSCLLASRQKYTSLPGAGELVQCQLAKSSPGELMQYQLAGSSPGELVQYQLAGSSPGELVQYQLSGSSPGEHVQYQLTGSSPGELVQYQLSGSPPGELVQYQLVGRASWRVGTLPAGRDSRAPNKMALYQLAGRDLAMVLNLHWHTRGYLPQVPGYPSEMASAGAGVANAWFL